MTLEDVLAKARAEAGDKGPSPVTAAAIAALENDEIQKLFQQPPDVPETRSLRVVVGGRIDGQEFLNVNGIK